MVNWPLALGRPGIAGNCITSRIWKGLKLNILADRFGRAFPYLRLSITDACNFRCQYCLPNGYRKTDKMSFLSVDEISRLLRTFAGLGMTKVRLTGGEPTLRRDLCEIATHAAAIPSVKTIALTTNGYSLKKNAKAYFDAGINALNVSIDSSSPDKFFAITGHDKLRLVQEGIAAAEEAGFKKIKINSVLLKGFNDGELTDFLAYIKNSDTSIRFIELMRTGDNQVYFAAHHLSSEIIIAQLLELGFSAVPRQFDAGPAIEYQHKDYLGKIGIIAPYSKDFCKSCNRLRVTARGKLMLCLFGEGGFDLRPFLQSDDQIQELQEEILAALNFKVQSHHLQMGQTGTTQNLAALGG